MGGALEGRLRRLEVAQALVALDAPPAAEPGFCRCGGRVMLCPNTGCGAAAMTDLEWARACLLSEWQMLAGSHWGHVGTAVDMGDSAVARSILRDQSARLDHLAQVRALAQPERLPDVQEAIVSLDSHLLRCVAGGVRLDALDLEETEMLRAALCCFERLWAEAVNIVARP